MRPYPSMWCSLALIACRVVSLVQNPDPRSSIEPPLKPQNALSLVFLCNNTTFFDSNELLGGHVINPSGMFSHPSYAIGLGS